MNDITIPAWIGKALYAVAVAALLGGGSTVLSTSRTVAVLEHKAVLAEKNAEKMDKLGEKLDQTNSNVAVLLDRLQRENAR